MVLTYTIAELQNVSSLPGNKKCPNISVTLFKISHCLSSVKSQLRNTKNLEDELQKCEMNKLYNTM